jgi:SWIM zinc finger
VLANVTIVAGRWSTGSVLALAPDTPSQRAAAGLAGASPWSCWGASGDLVWGACAGSGKDPYQVAVDLAGPAYRCSCPSRKFPCKHALGLLLNWADGRVPEQAEPADQARAWRASRAARLTPVTAKTPAVKNAAAAARRSRQRAERVAAGLAELQMWLCDQIRAGLSGLPGAGGHQHAEQIAARMVDAQAPGVANALRRLSPIPVSGDGWPGRLLAEYAQLHLLARAYGQLDVLPAGLGAVVRSRVGFAVSRDDVLASPAVGDRWLVLALRDVDEPPIPARRIWLRGRDTGRFALLVLYAVQGNFAGVRDAALTPGTELHAGLHYYPGQPPLRVAIGARRAEAPAAAPPEAAGDVATLLSGWAAALEQDPWLTEWPALLTGTPVQAGDRWYLADSSGAALPLLGRESLWRLLAVSGGHPVTVAGEWSPAGLTALTVWHGDQAVQL